MTNDNIRLRFAPSPTGFLHIGNLRTAFFGYLIAKSLGGKFILRIEDTDQKREVAGSATSLLKILAWVGIKFDEGPGIGGEYGPYIQTARLEVYKKLANELIEQGKAYRCFCSAERLTVMRAEQEKNKKPPRYDRTCRELSAAEIEQKINAGDNFVIRQKMPLTGEVLVFDELRGEIKFAAADLDDHVLIKSNGIPTYQFASVVDDHLMEISHVTRGDEWLASFPKNILLYQAFGWTPPKFIHLPLLLNKTGGKLSKRQGDVFVEQYKDKGYLPEAIINFCALLGWHPKGDKEILTLQELEKDFSINGMGVSPAIFDEEKLDYLNGYYIREKSNSELAELCRPFLEAAGLKPDERLENFVSLGKDRMKKIADAPELLGFFFKLPAYEENLLSWKGMSIEETKQNLQALADLLATVSPENWEKEKLETMTLAWIKDRNGKNGDYLWPLRVALSGQKNSPGPLEIAWALGKEETLARIKKSLTF
ncbi:MAG TPA: glutamate--tRNA ligase [Candidatus Saccharimonadales bacterium]|nr:glutamate--tRNA ligase [Candidatus Saccharimonadales bacterium]